MRPHDIEETPPILIPDLLAIGLILVWGLAWLAPGLAHPAIHNWDESFHQAVARGTADYFPAPTMYVDPLIPIVPRHWWYAGIWLHKAVGVFWWAAIVIKVFGVTTAALRSASLLSELGIAALIYLLTRPLAGRPLALASSLAFLILPWGWFMTQGHFVADVTDIAVTAFVTLGFAWFWWAAEKNSVKWAALAGAAVGIGYLCKTFLALDPLGVAATWWFLGRIGFCKGPRFSLVAVMFGTFVLFAAPWNIYAYLKWPDVFMRAFDVTVGFMSSTSGEDVGSGWRPVDAIFHEINWTLLKPMPYTFAAFAGIWLIIKSVRERDGRIIAITLWIWSTWIVHTLAHVKGHAHLWNVVPAVFVAYAVTLRDAFKHRTLAVAVIASFAVYYFKPTVGFLLDLRQQLPQSWIQTRSWEHTNFVEQFFFVPLITFAAYFALRKLRTPALRENSALLLGTLACVGPIAYAFPVTVKENRALAKSYDRDHFWSSSQDVGLAVDPVIDKKSVLFMDTNLDYGTTFEYLSLQFWSGRMVYRQPPDLALAQRKGYRPYLVSPASEPFAPLPQVPAYAQLRAYDLLAPAAPAPLPEGLTPLDKPLVNVHLKGWSARALDGRFSRYAFYAEPRGMPSDVRVIYHLDDGTSVEQRLQTQATLRNPDRLAQAPWFIFPDVGPLHTRVTSIECQQ